MGESIVEFIKIFCEKIWLWLIIAIASITSLFSQNFFTWLGFENGKRWIVGIVAIFSFSLSVQQICDWVIKYKKQKQTIKNIDTLPTPAIDELKEIVRDKKKTLKIKQANNIEQRRIVEHFGIDIHNDYATFPDYLWKELNLKFGNNENKSKGLISLLQKRTK